MVNTSVAFFSVKAGSAKGERTDLMSAVKAGYRP